MKPQAFGDKLSRDISTGTIPLFLKIRDNHEKVQFFAYYLEYLVFHMPDHMLMPSLNWLVRNGITGSKFLTFIGEECKNSGLELIRHLTMRLEKEKETRRLTVKDIR